MTDYQTIEFLDLEIFLLDGKLGTNLFVKPTNKQLYLEGIPYSQALRIIEWCATFKDRDSNLAQLQTKLEERNYPTALIQKQLGRAKKKDRRGLLFQERKDKSRPDDKARLIFTYSKATHPYTSGSEKVTNY